MIQKIDKEKKDLKKSNATNKTPESTDDKNHQLHLNKQSSHKTGKDTPKKFDPSGLPKYR